MQNEHFKNGRGLRATRHIDDRDEFSNSLNKRRNWRVSVNGKGMSFIPANPMSRIEAMSALRMRFSGCEIELSK